MSVCFRPLTEVAEEVCERLRKITAFKGVTFAAVTDYDQLLQLATTYAGLPRAIVVIGAGEYDHHGLTRSYTLGVVVITEFRADLKGEAAEIWRCHREIERLFMPRLTRDLSPDMPGGKYVQYTLRGWTPFEVGKKCSSVVAELNVVEQAAKEEK